MTVEGPETLALFEVRLDHTHQEYKIPLGDQVLKIYAVGVGPHTLELCFTNDVHMPTGDLNVWFSHLVVTDLVVEQP